MRSNGTGNPGYWMHETSGVLRPAVEAYLQGRRALTGEEIAAIRAYLRQWIMADWQGDVSTLRASVDGLVSRTAIKRWLDDAAEWGIDPL
jgi:hypothetical protein